MDNINYIIENINEEDRVEFLIDFLISELEGDKFTYFNIIKAINKIKSIGNNYDINSDLMSALITDCSNKMNTLYRSVENSMEILDLISEKFKHSPNINITEKISDLYKVNAEIYDICNRCKNSMNF